MTARSHWRGHPMHFDADADAWRYTDDGALVAETHRERSCGHCGEHATPEGHDACLGTLPGVMNACCGHGETEGAYVQFRGGACVRGREAVAAFKVLKRLRRMA